MKTPAASLLFSCFGVLALATVSIAQAHLPDPSQNDKGLSGNWAMDAVKTVRKFNFAEDFPRGYDWSPRLVSPDGMALKMTLKIDKTTLTGKVTDVPNEVKYDIKLGAVDGKKFEFVAIAEGIKSVGCSEPCRSDWMRVEPKWLGELFGENEIRILRWRAEGKPVDPDRNGAPETLVFHRAR